MPADPPHYFEHHVFCCTNVREPGHKRGCCAEKGAVAGEVPVGDKANGHFNADLRNFENVVNSPAAAAVARAAYYVLPNLAPFDVKAEAVYGMPISMRTTGFTLLYAAIYIGLLLTAAIAIFRRRDFK